MCDHEYCDDCGCRVYPKARCVVESLPCDIASANEGESATLCRRCYGIVTGQDAPVTDDNANPCRCCGEIVYDTDYDTCDTCEENTMNANNKENTMNANNTLNFCITVSGIKFRDWTISANVILTFEYDRNTNTFSHTQSSIGTNDGDIVGQGNNASIPNISFSNHVSVDAVRWAKMTADAGMNIGQRDEWIDAIYESDALRDAITHEGEFLSAIAAVVRGDFLSSVAAIVKEDTNA